MENLAGARGAIEIDATGKVVMPGFVDSHTHLIAGPSQSDTPLFPQGRPHDGNVAPERSQEKLLNAMRAVQGMTVRALEFHARKVVEGCIRHGTTTLEAKSGYGIDETTELRILRVLASLNQRPMQVVSTYLGAHITPPEFEGRHKEYLAWMCSRLMPIARHRRLAEFADVHCGVDGFDVARSRTFLEKALRLGLVPKVHAGLGEDPGIVPMAIELRAASVDGLNFVTESEAEMLCRSDTITTLLPGSSFYQGKIEYAPARMLLQQGAAVAIASGFRHGGSPSYNMQNVVALACSHMHMSAAEAISAATINGAHALRRAGRIGSLQTGKQADLIMLNVSDYREIPYYFGVNLVALTMRRGEIVYKEADVNWKEESSSV